MLSIICPVCLEYHPMDHITEDIHCKCGAVFSLATLKWSKAVDTEIYDDIPIAIDRIVEKMINEE